MALKYTNFVSTKLAAPLSAVDTTMSVEGGAGAKFPVLAAGDYTLCVLTGTNGAVEIVKVTAVSGDVLTIERAQENTQNASFAVGTSVQIRFTAGALQEHMNTMYATTEDIYAGEEEFAAITPKGLKDSTIAMRKIVPAFTLGSGWNFSGGALVATSVATGSVTTITAETIKYLVIFDLSGLSTDAVVTVGTKTFNAAAHCSAIVNGPTIAFSITDAGSATLGNLSVYEVPQQYLDYAEPALVDQFGTAAQKNIGLGATDVPTNDLLPHNALPAQSIIKAPLGARPTGWSPADCDAPVASMTASGTIVTVQAGLQVAYADSGRVRLSAELAAPLTVDLTAEADGTKYVYVNLAADGTIESAGITSSAPQVGYDRVDARLAPSGVNIGNMTLSGGLAAAFDGNVDQSAASSAAAGSSALGGYAGNDFGSPQALKYAIAYSSNNSGFWNDATTGKVQLWGSNSNDFTTATLISSVSITNTLSQRVVTLNADSSNYRYRWVQALPDNTTLSTYIAEIEWYMESQADVYNPATVTMLDSSDAPIRRVYLGFAVISSGVVTDTVCYALGDIVTLPVNNGSNIASGSNVYQSDTPYIGRMSSMITEIYATPISAWAEGGFFTDSDAARFARTTQGNDILYTTTGATALLESNSGYSGTRPIGQAVTSARARVVVKRGY